MTMLAARSRGVPIMTLDQFTLVIRRQPFQPFRMVMVDGTSFTVDHPESSRSAAAAAL